MELNLEMPCHLVNPMHYRQTSLKTMDCFVHVMEHLTKTSQRLNCILDAFHTGVDILVLICRMVHMVSFENKSQSFCLLRVTCSKYLEIRMHEFVAPFFFLFYKAN